MTVLKHLRGGVSSVSAFLKETLNFMFPDCCMVCGKLADADDRFSQYEEFCRAYYGRPSGLHLCGKCLSSFAPNASDRRWMFCLSDPYDGDPHPDLPLYMPLSYEGAAKSAVPAVKFGKKPALAGFMGCLLGTCLKSDSVHADLIFPIPLSASRMKERGFNQAEEIARPAAAVLGIPYAGNVLIRTRDTDRQTELKGNLSRIANVSGAFGTSEEWDIRGLSVIVVDDVATTGFTLHEAAEALFEAGAAKVLCAAVAGNRLAKNAEVY